MTLHRGPDLPYVLVAGVVPVSGGWLVASAKMHAATFSPESPKVYESVVEVLNERPSFASIVIYAPIGFRDDLSSPRRTCDVEARTLLGNRALTLTAAPTRWHLQPSQWHADGLDAVTIVRLNHYRELFVELLPFRQRTLYSGHPELSFYQLNGDVPLRWSKRREEGREERRALLTRRIPGITAVIDAETAVPEKHLYDAAALLWTARRVNGRAATRLPAEGEWDSEGLRTEFVY